MSTLKGQKAGIGSHTKPNRGDTVIWLTPKELLVALGDFDLDPCAAPSPRPWDVAKRHCELPEDGLLIPWAGRIFLNPPYDRNIDRWMKKMALHRNGIALLFARTETAFFQTWIWPYADSVLFLDGRLYFHYPDGSRAKGNSGGPSVLVAYSPADTKTLEESGLRGALVRVIALHGKKVTD
jgi:hypothetical protein